VLKLRDENCGLLKRYGMKRFLQCSAWVDDVFQILYTGLIKTGVR
jgi:hypothetical protein